MSGDFFRRQYHNSFWGFWRFSCCWIFTTWHTIPGQHYADLIPKIRIRSYTEKAIKENRRGPLSWDVFFTKITKICPAQKNYISMDANRSVSFKIVSNSLFSRSAPTHSDYFLLVSLYNNEILCLSNLLKKCSSV